VRARHRRPSRFKLWLAVLAACAVTGGLVDFALFNGTHASAQADLPPAPNTDLGIVYTPDQSFSQPDVMPTGSVDYLYSSGQGATPNVPLVTFTAIGQWSEVHDAMPTLPPWVEPGTVITSPDVRPSGNGYVMWFSAVTRAPVAGASGANLRCLGWARSSSPLGPFVSDATEPEVCAASDYGDDNPRTFVDGSQEYLLWNSGNSQDPGAPSASKLYSQALSSDGTTLVGAPSVLMQADQFWEAGNVETPDMLSYDGHYYLLFTGNFATSPAAGIGVAQCSGPSGPCSDSLIGPWLGSTTQGSGPSQESDFEQNGATWLLYSPQATYFTGARPELALSRLGFTLQLPYVAVFDGVQPNP
jgi:hypothetical protein